MIENVKVGDRVWVFDVHHLNPGKRIIREIEIIQVTRTETKDGISIGVKAEYWHGEGDQQYHSFKDVNCFPSLDALLSDLRSHAVYLEPELTNK